MAAGQAPALVQIRSSHKHLTVSSGLPDARCTRPPTRVTGDQHGIPARAPSAAQHKAGRQALAWIACLMRHYLHYLRHAAVGREAGGCCR